MKAPFEGDTKLEELMLQTIQQHHIDVVVETGTETGATAEWFARHVGKVYTVDLEHKLDRALPSNVLRHLMPSFKMLDLLLPKLSASSRVLFFLDAHVAPAHTAVLAELEVLGHQSLPDCVVVIHDFKVPGHPELGFDTYTKEGDMELALVAPRLDHIFPGGWQVTYNSEAAGAQRGVAIFSRV